MKPVSIYLVLGNCKVGIVAVWKEGGRTYKTNVTHNPREKEHMRFNLDIFAQCLQLSPH